MATAAKEQRLPHTRCVHPNDTVTAVALLMRDLEVRALPLRGSDNRYLAMITDRDIVTGCIASGLDPSVTTAGQLAGRVARTSARRADTEASLVTTHSQRIDRLYVGEGASLTDSGGSLNRDTA